MAKTNNSVVKKVAKKVDKSYIQKQKATNIGVKKLTFDELISKLQAAKRYRTEKIDDDTYRTYAPVGFFKNNMVDFYEYAKVDGDAFIITRY